MAEPSQEIRTDVQVTSVAVAVLAQVFLHVQTYSNLNMVPKERRICNPGPVPHVNTHNLVNKIIDYIDGIKCDGKIFELGTYYAEAGSNKPVDLDEIAKTEDFVVAVLKAAPSGRLQKMSSRIAC